MDLTQWSLWFRIVILACIRKKNIPIVRISKINLISRFCYKELGFLIRKIYRVSRVLNTYNAKNEDNNYMNGERITFLYPDKNTCNVFVWQIIQIWQFKPEIHKISICLGSSKKLFRIVNIMEQKTASKKVDITVDEWPSTVLGCLVPRSLYTNHIAQPLNENVIFASKIGVCMCVRKSPSRGMTNFKYVLSRTSTSQSIAHLWNRP